MEGEQLGNLDGVFVVAADGVRVGGNTVGALVGVTVGRFSGQTCVYIGDETTVSDNI